MFTNWASYAFIQLDGRDGLEPEILCIRPAVKGVTDFRIPGGEKSDGEEHSVETLIRTVYEQTGLCVKPHQIRRIKLPNRGRTEKARFRLRFYSIILTTEQFLDRAAVEDDSSLEFISLSQVIRMQELVEPHGNLISLAIFVPMKED